MLTNNVTFEQPGPGVLQGDDFFNIVLAPLVRPPI